MYDSEIGYCQGQSFLIAALLLQMPEEQTFGVLVKVMHDLGKILKFGKFLEALSYKKWFYFDLTECWYFLRRLAPDIGMIVSKWIIFELFIFDN